jgi:hypothetical protein
VRLRGGVFAALWFPAVAGEGFSLSGFAADVFDCAGRYVSCFFSSFPIFSINEGMNCISDFQFLIAA